MHLQDWKGFRKRASRKNKRIQKSNSNTSFGCKCVHTYRWKAIVTLRSVANLHMPGWKAIVTLRSDANVRMPGWKAIVKLRSVANVCTLRWKAIVTLRSIAYVCTPGWKACCLPAAARICLCWWAPFRSLSYRTAQRGWTCLRASTGTVSNQDSFVYANRAWGMHWAGHSTQLGKAELACKNVALCTRQICKVGQNCTLTNMHTYEHRIWP